MSAFTAVLTAAGSAAVLAAVQSGSPAVALTHMALGWGNAAGNPGYIPTGNEVALKREFLRTPIGNGQVIDAGTIMVQALFPAPQPQTGAAWELGLFTANGTLFAVVSRTDAPITWVGAVDDIIVPATIALANLPAGSVTWTASGASVDIMLDEPMADLATGIIALQSAVIGLREGLAPLVATPDQIAGLTAALNALDTRLQTGLATVSASPPRPFEVYVDPINGNDNSASPVGPFATLNRAVEAVPEYGVGIIYLAGDITVNADVLLKDKRITITRAAGVTTFPAVRFAASTTGTYWVRSFVYEGVATIIFRDVAYEVPDSGPSGGYTALPRVVGSAMFKPNARGIFLTVCFFGGSYLFRVNTIWPLFLPGAPIAVYRRGAAQAGGTWNFAFPTVASGGTNTGDTPLKDIAAPVEYSATGTQWGFSV